MSEKTYGILIHGAGWVSTQHIAAYEVVSKHGANLLWLPYVSYGAINGGITEARRILGAVDGTTLTYAPPVPAGPNVWPDAQTRHPRYEAVLHGIGFS